MTDSTAGVGPVERGVGRPVPERDVLDELRAAAARKWAGDPAAQRAGLFSRAAAEIEDLRRDLDENAALRERMADLLRRTAVALRGPEPPLTRWGWHDLPERAAAAVAAERERCADIVRNAAAHHGLCCSDCNALADLVAGLGA